MNKKVYINFIKPYLFKYCVLFSLVIFATFISLYQPIIFKNLLDVSLYSKDVSKLLMNISILIVIFILGQFIYYIQNITVTKVGEGILFDIRTKVFESIIFKPISFFSIQKTGESMNMLLAEISTIINFLLSTSLGLSSNIISILTSIILMLFLDFNIALSVIASSILCIFVVKKQNVLVSFFEKKLLDTQILLANTTNEILSNIKTIKYLNIYDFSIAKFDTPSRTYLDTRVEYAYRYSKLQVLLSSVCFFPTITLMSYGMYRVFMGQTSIGTIFAISNLLNMFMGSVKQLQNVNRDYQQFLIMSKRLSSIIEDLDNKNLGTKDIKRGFNINIKNLSFKYENKNVINNLNHEFRVGDIVHIKGPNGSGKTSLINLLSGLVRVQSGNILFNNLEISSLSYNCLKDLLGIVPQQIHLFSGTVKENILLGRSVKDSAIESLIDELGFHDIKLLLNEYVCEKGGNFSEGQRQKIAIIRSLISNPFVLIFDEASSSLDKESKLKLYEYLNSTRFERISFVITHEFDIDTGTHIVLEPAI